MTYRVEVTFMGKTYYIYVKENEIATPFYDPLTMKINWKIKQKSPS